MLYMHLPTEWAFTTSLSSLLQMIFFPSFNPLLYNKPFLNELPDQQHQLPTSRSSLVHRQQCSSNAVKIYCARFLTGRIDETTTVRTIINRKTKLTKIFSDKNMLRIVEMKLGMMVLMKTKSWKLTWGMLSRIFPNQTKSFQG